MAVTVSAELITLLLWCVTAVMISAEAMVSSGWTARPGRPGQATRQPVSLTTQCGSSSQSKCVWSTWPQAPLTTLGGATEKGQGCGGPWGPSLWRRKTSAGYVSNTRHHTDKRHRPQNQLRIKPERQHCYKFTSWVESLRETYSLRAWLFHPPVLHPHSPHLPKRKTHTQKNPLKHWQQQVH